MTENIEDKTPTSGVEKDTQGKPTPDSLKIELERVQKKGEGKTELEKAIYARKKMDERISHLQTEEGVETPLLDEDDNKPVTVADLRRLERERAHKTAINLADEIGEEHERELVKYHLTNTIRSSGNPVEDFKAARTLTNAAKNAQIVEELARKKAPPTHGSGGGAPALVDDIFEPSADEAALMKWSGMTKEDVLKARQASQ